MPQIHIHDILEMIRESSEAYSETELHHALVAKFGGEMRFGSCSIDGMDAVQAVEFLVTRGKYVPKQQGSSCCGACG